jgi:hypothetical protein
MDLEMLRCAQHDSAILLPRPPTAFDELFLRLMLITADLSALGGYPNERGKKHDHDLLRAEWRKKHDRDPLWAERITSA